MRAMHVPCEIRHITSFCIDDPLVPFDSKYPLKPRIAQFKK